MSVQDDAIKILDGIEEIARNQMLVRGVYITDEVVRPDLAEAHTICGGRQACMVGSMWIAAGFVVWEKDEDGVLTPELPGVTTPRLPDGRSLNELEEHEDDYYTSRRDLSLRARPDLKLAYDTMNEVCSEHQEAINQGIIRNEMERLFEATREDEHGNPHPVLTDDDLFAILDTARQRIRAQVPA